MIAPLQARRLAGLTIVFIGLLVAFSALGLAARGRAGPAAAAAIVGLSIAGVGTLILRRLPPAGPSEPRTGEPTP